MEDAWTPELLAARDVLRERCRRSNRVCAATCSLLAAGSAFLALRYGGLESGLVAAFAAGVLFAIGLLVVCLYWVPTPRQCRWLWILALPTGVVLGLATAPIVLEYGLAGEPWAVLAGLTSGLVVAMRIVLRRFYASPALLRRTFELGWDPAHPHGSFLRRR